LENRKLLYIFASYYLPHKLKKMDAVENAKKVLRDHGYFVDNLWHIQDVQANYMKASDEEAQKILNIALTNEATMEQISFAITEAIEFYFEDELDTDYED
jgi:hypothetical protein